MTTASSKIWLTAGAFAVAAAAALTPVMAQAAPADDTDSSAVGDAAGTPTPARANRGATNRAGTAGGGSAPVAGPALAGPASTPGAGATGSNPLFQNSLWWFGTPNPNPPAPAYTRTFQPLADLPGFSQPFFGWYRNLNFEACVLGVGNKTVTSVGPYGTSTSSISTGGC
jgi:hypothetical protein